MSIPIVSVAQMREWEKATWAAGQTEAEVIRRVGKKIARRARKLTRSDDLILVLAGKGNNGNDARAAAEFLEERQVALLNVASPAAELPKLQDLLRRRPDLVIDGLFGIGLNRPLDDDWQQFIRALNDARRFVLAIDAPSGLNCDTGLDEGAAVEAAMTLTVGAPKPGMLAASAWPLVGRLEVLDDVGLIPCPLSAEMNWTESDDFTDFPPRRAVAAHKGSFGHLAIVAGSFGYHGAAVLAARAAQRAQPGLVTLFTREEVYSPVASQLQAVMVNGWKANLKFPETVTAILFGPGLHAPGIAEEMKPMLRKLWRDAELPVVVDASALDWLAPHILPDDYVRVVTPHPGEAARLLNWPTAKVQANRVGAVREISRQYGNCWVVLKGHQTVIGRSRGEVHVNSSGNPHLAQGGSGDVLSGFFAGLAAQPELQKDLGQALRFAAWQHGAAADELQASRRNWVVEDLVEQLGGL